MYRYDVALATNALGAKYGCEFAKKCPNLKLLLHVSTGMRVYLYMPFFVGEKMSAYMFSQL